MSFDDLCNSLSSSGRPAEGIADLELDIAILSSLVVENGENPADDSELSELLAHLDSANSMAGGVEAKLDDILDTLDNLLTDLEPADGDKTQEATIPPSELQPSKQS